MKTQMALGLLVFATTSYGALSDYDKGRCEALSYRAEEICVELVCDDYDNATIRECKQNGDFAKVMKSCHPEILPNTVSDYNKRSADRPVDCRGFSYKPKF